MVGMVPVALAAMVSGASLPQTVPPIPLVVAQQPPLPDDPLNFTNAENRMNVLVKVDGHGPYTFVIDTGAERTVVSHDLAHLLDLKPGRDVTVIAMTNQAVISTVIVPSLSINNITAKKIEAPALDAVNLGAPGILGLDALQGHSVAIDFARNEMTVSSTMRRQAATFSGLSYNAPTDPHTIVVTARNLHGQLIMTDAYCHGQRVSVLIDTGTPVTIANAAFLKIRGVAPKSIGTVIVTSALGRELTADFVVVDHLEIGGIGFDNVPLAATDAEPFRRLGLADKPALLLGMDALRLFRQVDIDFANREIRFRLPDSPLMASR